MSVNRFLQQTQASVELKPVTTRFRAYQLGEAGASYSYFSDGKFVLVEARRTADMSHRALMHEMKLCGKSTIDTLHITSWDRDHCNPPDLTWILDNLSPTRIEYPGYPPHTDTARESLKIITAYKAKKRVGSAVNTICVDPPYISSLGTGTHLGYRDIFYHPRQLYENNSNNNSTVKLFRTGSFNVASLGDVEHSNIGAYLRSCKIFSSETDALILPHHGAPSDITTKKFIETVKPTVAICTSNFGNQYDHPDQNNRDMLYHSGVKLFTTKTGDVIIKSIGNHDTSYQVINLKSNSEEVSSTYDFKSKKSTLLSMNADTIRNRYHPGFKGLKK